METVRVRPSGTKLVHFLQSCPPPNDLAHFMVPGKPQVSKVNQIDWRYTISKKKRFHCRWELSSCAPLQRNLYIFCKLAYLPLSWLTYGTRKAAGL